MFYANCQIIYYLSTIIFQILNYKKYESLWIKGNKYYGMNIAKALNLAQFIVESIWSIITFLTMF